MSSTSVFDSLVQLFRDLPVVWWPVAGIGLLWLFVMMPRWLGVRQYSPSDRRRMADAYLAFAVARAEAQARTGSTPPELEAPPPYGKLHYGPWIARSFRIKTPRDPVGEDLLNAGWFCDLTIAIDHYATVAVGRIGGPSAALVLPGNPSALLPAGWTGVLRSFEPVLRWVDGHPVWEQEDVELPEKGRVTVAVTFRWSEDYEY